MSIQISKPIQGPSITWNYNHVKEGVDKLGFEGAVDTFSSAGLNKSYVRKMIKEILALKLEEVSSISGGGSFSNYGFYSESGTPIK